MNSGAGVIRRKLGSGQPTLAGADRVWAQVFRRAGLEAIALDMGVESMPPCAGVIDDLCPDLPENALVIPLTRDDGAVGAAVLSAGLFQAMVEWQLSGAMAAQETPRSPTRTDAMLMQSLIDSALDGLEQALAGDDDLPIVAGFRAAEGLGTLQNLTGEYRRVGATVRIGNQQRSGSILMFLPSRASLKTATDQDRHFNESLQRHVLGTEAVMQAVLHRMSLPLASIMALREGACVPLTGASVQDMTVESVDGKVLAKGRLGQHRGMRAVRLALNEADVPQSNVVALRDAS